jgi:hypothetical protein
MPAARTYEPLATTTLGSAAATIDFNSISGAYTDLVFIIQLASTSSNNIFVRLNSNTGSNYSCVRLGGSGSGSGVSESSANQTYLPITYYGWPTSTMGDSMTRFQIQNYSNSTTNKTMLWRSDRAGNGPDTGVGLWRSNSAITSVSFSTNGFAAGTSIAANSIITLYGITAA